MQTGPKCGTTKILSFGGSKTNCMVACARNTDIQGQSAVAACSNNKTHRKYLRMPILADLSRRLHMLTTDAKPDPPRVEIEGHTHNLIPPTDKSKSKSKSAPTSPTNLGTEHSAASIGRQKSVPNGAIPEEPRSEEQNDATSSPSEPREYRKPRTKSKSKQSKFSQATNVINYNIVNSNGVKIGSRTSYICNINQFPANNTASSEATWGKSKMSRLMPEEVESLTACSDEITFEDMFVIKTHVGHGWRDIARRLSYSEGQIEQFEENYRHKGIDEVVYQLLLDWKQTNTKDAQIGNLVDILWSCQEYECAEKLAASHRNSSC